MGVREDGLVCGSVSGGCVETAVIEAAQAALADGAPKELLFEAVTEDSVWDVGLSCGGRIQILVEPDPMLRDPEPWRLISERTKADQPTVLITSYDPPERRTWIPGEQDPLGGKVEGAYVRRSSTEVEVEGKRYFLNVLGIRERLLIVGSVHIAVPLVKFAKTLGFETVVADPRAAFADIERFPTPPDQIVVEWPEQAFEQIGLTADTYAAVLTHDPKIDDVALAILLKSPVAYIGALGSRVTQAKRRAILIGLGFSEDEISRIHGPIGLNIGARSPEEIALSIAAEIVQVRRSRT
jgi:xanthine dehydrogenase accessory factor